MSDITTHHGKEMLWNGHLCEGARMVEQNPDTFLLWTRCGALDVPAGKAYTGGIIPDDIGCPNCAKIWHGESQ